MVEEIWGIWEGLDTWSIREDINKVSEQAKKKANDDSKKAKQVQQQIQKDKQENNNLAKFLTFLLKEIKNEELIKILYEAFFKTYNKKTETTYLRKNINTIVVVWFFAPFYPNEIKEFQLEKYFNKLIDKKNKFTIKEYIQYIKKLSHAHHDNIPINIENLINLLVIIIYEYNLNNHHSVENKTTEDLKLFFKKELGIR